MSAGKSIRSWVTNASRTPVGDGIVTVVVLMILIGTPTVLLFACEYLFHWVRH